MGPVLRRSGWAALALVLGAAGCTALFGYPEPSAENTADACSDGIDNDFNGAIDCADPSCDGFCPEGEGSSCSDGRDNDGDGLPDGSDPGCWHGIGPGLRRCGSTEPTDFEERFDSALSTARWAIFGAATTSADGPVRLEPPAGRASRPDPVLGLAAASGGQHALAGLTSRSPFDGEWSAFELGFQVRLESQGFARIGLVPAALAPTDGPPVGNAELASLAIELDAREGASFALLVNGERSTLPTPELGSWHTVTLAAVGKRLELQVDGALVAKTARPSIGAARLVVWGASARAAGEPSAAELDDLHLRLAGGRPCDIGCPQIPFGSACQLDASALAENVGYTVSLAAEAPSGPYCALLTSGDLGQNAPVRAESWISDTGRDWRAGAELPLGEGLGTLVGAAVARDAKQSQWRAAVVDQRATSSELRVARSDDCKSWTPAEVVAGVELPRDAQAPSYLVPGVVAPYEVLFTMPPAAAGQGVTLWRLRSDDASSFTLEDSPVATFPADSSIDAPVSLSRVGPQDIVLTHRISPASGMLGLGLWVAADGTLGRWDQAARWPLVESEPAAARFDSGSILSGSLVWAHSGPLLLYGAEGVPIPGLYAAGVRATTTVGTAELWASGAAGTSSGPAAETSNLRIPGLCGNGTCDADESCDLCPIDCDVCDGELRLADTFDSGVAWSLLTSDQASTSGSLYWSELSKRLNMAPAEPGWLQRTLDPPVFGDFELSFDVQWSAPEPQHGAQRCVAFVGVASEASPADLDPVGIFVQLDQQLPCSPGAPSFSPAVRTAAKHLTALDVEVGSSGKASCSGTVTGVPELWHHVTLRRQSGVVSLRVAGRDSCGELVTDPPTVAYPGPLDDFVRVMFGRAPMSAAGGANGACDSATAALSIDNLVLRTLPCPPDGQSCTEPQSGQTVCVDLGSSPEHCGGCLTPVDATERCVAGSPWCAGVQCTKPNGTQVCADLDVNPYNCGTCNHAVGPLEECGDGYARAASVEMPQRFTIDATEVTRAQYDAWLNTTPSTANQPASCAWNTSFVPSCEWPPAAEEGNLPVECVDWCDAYAYCAGVGKRLCGKVGGGPVGYAMADSTASQWVTACSANGVNDFPYGDSYEPKTCNGQDNKPGGAPFPCATLKEAGAMAGCQSAEPGYAGVFDLSGNLFEWIDSCTAQTGEQDLCHSAGGSTCRTTPWLDCTTQVHDLRSTKNPSLGFRCCRY